MIDYISRQAAINLIQEDKIKLVEPYLSIYKATGCSKEAETQVFTCDRHIEMIKKIPTADVVERKRGEWRREVLGSTSGYGTTVMYQCSNCEKMAMSEYNFCPNCGADMRGGEDDKTGSD